MYGLVYPEEESAFSAITGEPPLVPMFIVSYTTIDSFKTYRRGWYLSSILVASLFCPAVPIIQFWCTFFLLSMYETTLMYLCITSKRV